MRGRINYFNQEKGYGFIIGEDNLKYFFHISNTDFSEEIHTNAYVEFVESSNQKGLCALNVRISYNKSKVIIFGDVRIKTSNIKNYGFTKKKYPYEKIFEEVSNNYKTKLGKLILDKYSYVWNGKTEMISDERYKHLKAVNDKDEYKQPGHQPFRIMSDGIFSTYIKYIDVHGKKQESQYIYTSDKSDDENAPYVWKDIECLYVTTFQNDNFVFRSDMCGFDIYEKCKEIDVSLQ